MKKLPALLLALLPLAAAAQPPYELDLRDLMDAHYGAGAWTQRTGIGAGTDIGPAIADGIAALHSTISGKRGKILIPPGTWLETTPPGDLSGIYLEGAGSQASIIVFNNAASVALNWTGAGGYTGGGARGIGLLLESGLGNTNSYGILLQGNATFQPDQTEWDDIYLSAIGGSSFWWDGFHADGSARSAPQGVRVSSVNNVQIFNCRNIGFYGSNLVQWTLNNVGTYTGTGLYGNSTWIVGGAAHVFGLGVNSTLIVAISPTPGFTSDVWINGQRFN